MIVYLDNIQPIKDKSYQPLADSLTNYTWRISFIVLRT